MDHNNNNRYAHQILPPPPPLSFPPARVSSDNHNFYHNHNQFPQPLPPPPPRAQPPLPLLPPPPPYHHLPRQFYDREPSPRVPYVSSDHYLPTLFDAQHQREQRQICSPQGLPQFYPEVVLAEEGGGRRNDWIKPPSPSLPPPPPPRVPPISWNYGSPNYHNNHHSYRDRSLDPSISPHHPHRREEEGFSNSYYSGQNRFSQQHPHQVESLMIPDYHHPTNRGDGALHGYQNQDLLWNQSDRRPNDNYMYQYGSATDQEPTTSWRNGEVDNEDWRRRYDSHSNDNHNEQKTVTTFDIEVDNDGHRVFTRKKRLSPIQPGNGKFRSKNSGDNNLQEIFPSPTKKPQRTSALLRVQSAKKSTPRKRRGGDDSLSSKQRLNGESSDPSIRSRRPLKFSDTKAPTENRETIPVKEVDVSFKSNSLVAKANSVSLNSAATSVSKSKKRKITDPMSGSSLSPVTKLHEDRLRGTSGCLKETKDGVGNAECGIIDNIGSQVGNNRIDVSLDRNGVVRPLSSSVCIDGISKSEIKNKKKRSRKKVKGNISDSQRSRIVESHDIHKRSLSSNHGADAASSSEKSKMYPKTTKVLASMIVNSGGTESPLSFPLGSNKSPRNKKRRFGNPRSGSSRNSMSGPSETCDEPGNAPSSNHRADGASIVDKSLRRSEEKVLASVIEVVDSHPLVISSSENPAGSRSNSSLVLHYDAEQKPTDKKRKRKLLHNLGFPSFVVKNAQGTVSTKTSHHDVGAGSDSYKCQMQTEQKITDSDTQNAHDLGSQSSHRSSEPLEVRGVADVKNFTKTNMNVDMLIKSSVLNVNSLPPELENGQHDVVPVVNANNLPQCSIRKENIEFDSAGKREAQIAIGADENVRACNMACEDAPLHLQLQENVSISALEVQTSVLDEGLPSKTFEDDSDDLLVKAEYMANNMSPAAQSSNVSATNSTDRIDCSSDRQEKANSHESFSAVPEPDVLNSRNSYCSKTKDTLHKKLKARDRVLITGDDSSASGSDIKVTSDEGLHVDNLLPERTLLLPSQETKLPAQFLSPTGGELIMRKPHSTSPIPNTLHTRTTLPSGTLKRPSNSTNVARHRTWHRTDNVSTLPLSKSCLTSSPSQGHSQRKSDKIQNSSYVRKGNSLVRNCSPVSGLPQGSNVLSSSVYLLNPVARNESGKGGGSEKNVNIIKPPTKLRTSYGRATTPSIPHQMKFANCTTKSSPDFSSSTSTSHALESEATLNPSRVSESDSAPKLAEASEIDTTVNSTLETQSNINNENSIIYVKHKSNQLLAARHPSPGPSAKVPEKNQMLPCSVPHDQYYKRKKNQLILTAPLNQSHSKLAVTPSDEGSHSEGQRTTASFLKCSRKLSKQIPDKILFPWKRTTYWKKIATSQSNRSCSSLISRKLLVSRKRDTVYTRSTGGFSLRRSKVYSIGGSNLKWSKSIEKNSKKANEEATLAVAAVEKKKREQKGAAYAIARSKSRDQSSRGRIFRIGSVRYKMDSSRRTLQRIPDEKSSCSRGQQLGKTSKVPFIPKRLLIGNNEYIRIGNGKKLIRDPKTRVRILASEKVRWSLHTARLRLARKQQYCQFFTRFGKCKKQSGKCPYIHDPAKIAVCTKYLSGLCSNTNCKLTHKVIPERMQDCSYFLQGLCTNKDCPYRHVNVNPDASVCDDFLKGYCAEGNECHKKHSYVCPEFESSGVCPQGKKCKLHHPKSQNPRETKRKHSKDDNGRKTKRRYFGSNSLNGELETGMVDSTNKGTEQKRKDSNVSQEGILADYISLDLIDSDMEVEEEAALETTNNEVATDGPITTLRCDSDSSDILESYDVDDDDELLIKPFAIMNVKKDSNITEILSSSSRYLADHRQELDVS